MLTETQDTWRDGQTSLEMIYVACSTVTTQRKKWFCFATMCMNLRCGCGEAPSYLVHGQSAEMGVFSLTTQVEFKRLIHLLLVAYVEVASSLVPSAQRQECVPQLRIRKTCHACFTSLACTITVVTVYLLPENKTTHPSPCPSAHKTQTHNSFTYLPTCLPFQKHHLNWYRIRSPCPFAHLSQITSPNSSSTEVLAVRHQSTNQSSPPN